MRILLAAAMLFAASPLVVAQAQDKAKDGQSAAPSAWTKELIESPPKREIRFERAPDPRKHGLSRPQPKLLEQKYSASFNLAIPLQSNRSDDVRPDTLLELPLSRWETLFTVEPLNTRVLNVDGLKISTMRESFQAAIAAMPASQRPNQEVVDYFTSDEIGYLLRPDRPTYGRVESTTQGRRVSDLQVPIELLAVSTEQAEKVAAGLVQILDWGICRPAQADLLVQRETSLKSLEEAKRTLAEGEKGAKLEVMPAGNRSMIWSGEIANSLTALRVQLLVEQTGIKARMNACERLMARDGLAPERRNTLEDERLKAEVDLASVEARLAAIAATFHVASAENKVRSYQRAVAAAEQQLDRFAPPGLVDGVVVIRPLEWQ